MSWKHEPNMSLCISHIFNIFLILLKNAFHHFSFPTVRTPIEVLDEEAKRPPDDEFGEKADIARENDAMGQVEQAGAPGAPEHPDGGAPLKPQLSVKLGRSISNRTARPHRPSRVSKLCAIRVEFL